MFLGQMVGEGAEILACAINENGGPEAMDHRYMAIWKVADREFAEKIESGARSLGFLDYFEQVNFSGAIITPDVMNGDMLGLKQ